MGTFESGFDWRGGKDKWRVLSVSRRMSDRLTDALPPVHLSICLCLPPPGVLLFEMLYGRTPFVGPTLKETLMNVLHNRLSFPRSPSVSSDAKLLMAALLTKQPEARLGSKMGAIEIRAHPFFAQVGWGNQGEEVPKLELEVPVEHYHPLAACSLTIDTCHQPGWGCGTNQGIALSFTDQ